MATAKVRHSGIELLRVVSMLMVLGVHIDGASLGLPEKQGLSVFSDGRALWQLAVESLCIVGVNCFTLISGYFGIRLTVRGVCRFLGQCLFYGVGIYAFGACAGYVEFSWQGLVHASQILSRTDLWYVPAYFALMLLSPFLNAGVALMGRKRFVGVLGCFVAFNLWSGWLFGGKFNPTGYTVVQLVMMYLIGQYISRNGGLFRSTLKSLVAYLVFTAGIFASSLWLDSREAFAYNSPFVVGASVALFLCFRSLGFVSKKLNALARSAFAVYLIHKNPIVWGHILKPECIAVWKSTGTVSYSIWALGVCAGMFALASVCEQLRHAAARVISWICGAVVSRRKGVE